MSAQYLKYKTEENSQMRNVRVEVDISRSAAFVGDQLRACLSSFDQRTLRRTHLFAPLKQIAEGFRDRRPRVAAAPSRSAMLRYFPWSENIKKRSSRYLLQRYLGQFLEEKLTLEQLEVDLYNGTGAVTDLRLDCQVRPFTPFRLVFQLRTLTFLRLCPCCCDNVVFFPTSFYNQI